MKIPPPLEKMMFGFVESQVLFVCNELQLFDFLIDSGPASIDQIAASLKLPESSLERLLICAHCFGLLKKYEGKYRVTSELTPFLSTKSGHYCGGRFSHYFKTSYRIFDHLLSAVRENRPQWHKIIDKTALGQDLSSVYVDYIYSNRESTSEFLSTMWASGYTDSLFLCDQISFSDYKNLIDLGGATGSFAIAALEKNPELSAVIVDYPQVKPFAENELSRRGLDFRAKFHAGDLFKDPLPKGDLYSIGYLLSDWPESMCIKLIQKVYDRLPVNGRIVILEKLFDDDMAGPYLTAALNLTMLLEMHGKHRSALEYEHWLMNAGFLDFQVIRSSGEKHMITAVKKTSL